MSNQTTKWADPGPTGLWALGIVLMCLWAQLTGLIDSKSGPAILGWVFCAGIAQTLVGIIGFRNGNFSGANLLTTFGVFFCFGTCLAKAVPLFAPVWFIQKFGPAPSTLIGIILCYLAIVLAFFLPLLTRGPSLLFWVILVAVPVIFALGLLDAGVIQEHYARLLGWIIFVIGLTVLYLGGAECVNIGLGKHVLPMGKPLVGAPQQSHSKSHHA